MLTDNPRDVSDRSGQHCPATFALPTCRQNHSPPIFAKSCQNDQWVPSPTHRKAVHFAKDPRVSLPPHGLCWRPRKELLPSTTQTEPRQKTAAHRRTSVDPQTHQARGWRDSRNHLPSTEHPTFNPEETISAVGQGDRSGVQGGPYLFAQVSLSDGLINVAGYSTTIDPYSVYAWSS